MSNGMSVKGIVILTIEENYNLVEQTKVFVTVCKYMGLMDNNSPKEEIHHREDASWYYDQAEIPWLKFHDMLDAMEMLLEYTADLAHTVEDLKTRMNSMRTVAAVNLLQNNVREHCYTKFYGTVRDAFLDGNNPLRATSNYRVPTDQRQRWFNIFWEGIYLP